MTSVFRIGKLSHKSWLIAQDFEFKHARQFMNRQCTRDLLERINSSANLVSRGWVDESLLKDFFGGSLDEWQLFLQHITDKNVLEVGPCIAAQVANWDVARNRFAIEPLYDKISHEQRLKFGVDGYPNVKAYSVPAEELIADFVGMIDGAVLIRNCLDHSPAWPFIMANLGLYTTKGTQLLLWNDLWHPRHLRRGHFEICKQIDQFRNLLLSFGWRIIYEFQMSESKCVNFGCRAEKN